MAVLDIKGSLSKVLVLCFKDMRLYYFKGPTIVMGVLMPMFLWLAFVIGAKFSLVKGLPMLIVISSFFTSSSITPIIMPWETRQRTLEMLLSRPVTIYTILFGTALASTFFGMFISSILVCIGLLLNLVPYDPALLVLGVVISSLCYSFMGLLFAAIPSDVPADTVLLSSAIRLPILFISGIFIPIQNLPYYITPLAFLSPLTYFADLIKYIYYRDSSLDPLVDLIVLSFLTVMFMISALFANKATLMKRL